MNAENMESDSLKHPVMYDWTSSRWYKVVTLRFSTYEGLVKCVCISVSTFQATLEVNLTVVKSITAYEHI